VLSVLHIVAALAVTMDAVLRKRNVRSVIGWVGLAWLAPLAGSAVYVLFGVNRIRRAAVALNLRAAGAAPPAETTSEHLAATGAAADDNLAGLAKLGRQITGVARLTGNLITPLHAGDEAYPAMLGAIDGATRSITLLTYIFDTDYAGRLFVDALARARQRGVEVRVLIDAVGARYSRSAMLGLLRDAGVRAAAFLPARTQLIRHTNLRNHRKILVVDGETGFTGGMNIREGHMLRRQPASPVACLHFEVRGPVVADMQRVFALDWQFTTGERLSGAPWFTRVGRAGSVVARGIPDGPDEDLSKVLEIILGAIAVARRRIRIVTPYFVPDEVVQWSLQVAALRGVEVDVVVPDRSNIALVDWAMAPQLPFLIDKGCRVFRTPPPFDHSKVFVVDDAWSLIGSTNWDARSLRLNFEYCIECYDATLAARLNALIDEKIARAERMDAGRLRSRPLPIRLRDGLARLLTPYL